MHISRLAGAVGFALALSACPSTPIIDHQPDGGVVVDGGAVVDAGVVVDGGMVVDAGVIGDGGLSGYTASSVATGGTVMSSPTYQAIITLGQGPGDNTTMSSTNNILVGGVAGATQGR